LHLKPNHGSSSSIARYLKVIASRPSLKNMTERLKENLEEYNNKDENTKNDFLLNEV
jgi:hypothetical protein